VRKLPAIGNETTGRLNIVFWWLAIVWPGAFYSRADDAPSMAKSGSASGWVCYKWEQAWRPRFVTLVTVIGSGSLSGHSSR